MSQLGITEKIVVSGGFETTGTAKFATCNVSGPADEYANNHMEADTLVWLHAVKCPYNRVVIYSPDNDVYHISLPLLEQYPNKNFTVQVTAAGYDQQFFSFE